MYVHVIKRDQLSTKFVRTRFKMHQVCKISVCVTVLFIIRTVCSNKLCSICDCYGTAVMCVAKTLRTPIRDENVEHLYIQNSEISRAFSSSVRLPSLMNLNIINSSVGQLNENVFSTSRKLNLLQMSATDVRHFHSQIFSANKRLCHIDLSRNNLRDIHSNLFSRQTNLTFLILNDNELRAINKYTFLYNTNLVSLDISSNRIRSLGPEIFYFRGITNFSAKMNVSLNMSHNSLFEIQPHTFSSSPQLTIMDLSHNQIKNLHSEFFVGLFSLRELFMRSNSIANLAPGIFSALKSLQLLDLSNNAIKEIPTEIFTRLPDLSRLLLSENKIRYVDRFAFRGMMSLTELFLSDNVLKDLGSAFMVSLPSLRNLQATQNRILQIKTGMFSGCPMLVELDLSDNAIYDIQDAAFFNSNRLSKLLLRDNTILNLRSGVFVGLSMLEILDLRGNYLKNFQHFPFASLANLRNLFVDLDSDCECECLTFMKLKELKVQLIIESKSLSETCSEYYVQYSGSRISRECPKHAHGDYELVSKIREPPTTQIPLLSQKNLSEFFYDEASNPFDEENRTVPTEPFDQTETTNILSTTTESSKTHTVPEQDKHESREELGDKIEKSKESLINANETLDCKFCEPTDTVNGISNTTYLADMPAAAIIDEEVVDETEDKENEDTNFDHHTSTTHQITPDNEDQADDNFTKEYNNSLDASDETDHHVTNSTIASDQRHVTRPSRDNYTRITIEDNESSTVQPDAVTHQLTTATVVYSLLVGAGAGVACAVIACLVMKGKRCREHEYAEIVQLQTTTDAGDVETCLVVTGDQSPAGDGDPSPPDLPPRRSRYEETEIT